MDSDESLSEEQKELNSQELISTLESLETQLCYTNQDTVNRSRKDYTTLSLLLFEERFLKHDNKYVQLLVASSIAELLKVLEHHPPFENLHQLKVVLIFLVCQLRGLKCVNAPHFDKYNHLFAKLVKIKLLSFISKLRPKDKNDILCRLFKMIFKVISDRQPPDLKSHMYDFLCHFLHEEYTISPSVLKILLNNINDSIKSSKPCVYNISKELITKNWKDLSPDMSNLLAVMVIVLKNLNKSLLCVEIKFDEVLKNLGSSSKPPDKKLVLAREIELADEILDDDDFIVMAEEFVASETASEGETTRECNSCGKKFNTTYNLNRHKLVHSGKKPFQCQMCPRSFNQKVHLERHFIMQHLKGKQFKCELCGRKFYQKSDLYRHIILHSGLKPFPCHICDKRFALREGLNDHEKCHEQGKPYKCGHCRKSYRRLKTLIKHVKLHEEDLLEATTP